MRALILDRPGALLRHRLRSSAFRLPPPALAASTLGQLIFGLGIVLNLQANVGLGPWPALSYGTMLHLPISYGQCRVNLDGLVLVDDDQLMDAQAVLFREMKLAVEPAAAAATAALVGPLREKLEGRKVGVLVCGSNIDLDTFETHVRQADGQAG